MDVTVYADVLFFINFSMDFLALYVVSFLLKTRFHRTRTVVAASIGALYGVISVIRHKDGFLIAIPVAVIMCLTAFGTDGIKNVAFRTLSFVCVSFLLGGGMTAVFNIFNSYGYQRLVSIYGQVDKIERPLDATTFVIGAASIAAISLIFCRIFTRKGRARTVYAEITLGDRKTGCFLTEDSGNCLREPSSGDPVIFVSVKAFGELLGKDIAEGLMALEAETVEKMRKRLRLTAYETVNGGGVAPCIRPDKIKMGEREVRAVVTAVKRSDFGEYDGIVPSALLMGKT